MKTAMQLVLEAHNNDENDFYNWFASHQQELLDKEKEQMEDFFYAGLNEGMLRENKYANNAPHNPTTSEQYYTKTYNQ